MDKQLFNNLVQNLKDAALSKERERQQLRECLLAGRASNVGPVADNVYFEALRKQCGDYQQTSNQLDPNQR